LRPDHADRPDKLNALNYELIDRLMAALDLIETDAGIGAVILTGAGERLFRRAPTSIEFSGRVRRGPVVAVRDFVRADRHDRAARSVPPNL